MTDTPDPLALVEEMERLAANATPGPWTSGQIKHTDGNGGWDDLPISTGVYGNREQLAALAGKRLKATAEFIAACSPDRILSLCEAVRASLKQQQHDQGHDVIDQEKSTREPEPSRDATWSLTELRALARPIDTDEQEWSEAVSLAVAALRRGEARSTITLSSLTVISLRDNLERARAHIAAYHKMGARSEIVAASPIGPETP